MFTRREFIKASAIIGFLNPLALIEPVRIPDNVEEEVPEMTLDRKFLAYFIEEGERRWEVVQDSFAADQTMKSFLAKAVPIVCFDHMQFDIKPVRELYEQVTAEHWYNWKEQESRRLERVGYYETIMQELALEVRFPVMKMDFIDRLKRHTLIKGLNSNSTSSIAVVIHSYRRNQGGGHGKKA